MVSKLWFSPPSVCSNGPVLHSTRVDSDDWCSSFNKSIVGLSRPLSRLWSIIYPSNCHVKLSAFRSYRLGRLLRKSATNTIHVLTSCVLVVATFHVLSSAWANHGLQPASPFCCRYFFAINVHTLLSFSTLDPSVSAPLERALQLRGLVDIETLLTFVSWHGPLQSQAH